MVRSKRPTSFQSIDDYFETSEHLPQQLRTAPLNDSKGF